jgi:phytol kinase
MLYDLLSNLPKPSQFITWALLALTWSYCCLILAGRLKTKLHLRTGYTRKVFHVLIFSSAVIANFVGGLLAVCVFGAMVSIVVAHAVLSGPGSPVYEALAREQDRPNRTYYIIIPYFATLIGGLASNIFFGPLAVIGYLVGGLGDAAGEPVGTRWGRHRYAGRGWNRAVINKTLEGSLAVLIASSVALLIGVAISPQLHFDSRSLVTLPVIAVVCTLVEAFSPRGWDNVPMQFVPTVLAAILLSK